MSRILHSRTCLLNSSIRKSQFLNGFSRLSATGTWPAQRELDDDNHQMSFETAAPHYELIEVLNHRSTQLQSNFKTLRITRTSSASSEKSINKSSIRSRSSNSWKEQRTVESNLIEQKPLDLARPNPSKLKEKKKKNNNNKTKQEQKKEISSSSTPPDRLNEIREKLHLTISVEESSPTIVAALINEEDAIEEDEEQQQHQSNEPALPPSVDEMTFSDDDTTLSDLLSSLHSTKVRRMHKYTDEQLAFMQRHNEFNRQLQSYVDVAIHNGKFHKVRRFVDKLLDDQDRRQTMKRMSWRYVSNLRIYNSFFFAYAENGNLVALQKSLRKNAQISN